MKTDSIVKTWLAALLALPLLFVGCSRAAKESRHLDRGNRYYEAKEFEKAEIEYLNVLKANYTNAVAMSRLAKIYFDQGEARKAFPALMSAVKLLPDDIDLRIKLGTLLILGGQPDKAREEAVFILQKQPLSDEGMLLLSSAATTPEAIQQAQQTFQKLPKEAASRAAFHIAQGNMQVRLKNLKEAEAAFKRAVGLDAKNTGALVGLANVAWMKGDLKEADRQYAAAAQIAPAKSNEHLAWVEFKLRTGDVAGAKKILQEQIEKAPDHGVAILRLAQIFFDERKWDECGVWVKKALALDKAGFDAFFLEARLQLAQGDIGNGLTALERLAAKNPRVPQLKFEMANAYLRTNNVEKAQVCLKDAIELEPNYAEAVMLQAGISINKGEFTPAVLSLQEFLKRRQVPGVYLLLASAYRARGTPDDALAVYRTLEKLAPTNAQVPFLIGTTLREKRMPAEARKEFEKCLRLAPDYEPAELQLIDVDVIEKAFAAALRRADAIAKRHPESPQPPVIIARIHVAQKNYSKAEAVLKQVVEKHPDDSAALMELSKVYSASGKSDMAIKELEKVLEKNPRNPTVLLQLGLLEEQKRNFDKAVSRYQQVVEIQPKALVALNNLAYIYADQLGKLDAAYDAAKKARDAARTEPSIADTLGWVLYKRGDFTGALPLIQEAVEKLSDNPEVSYHLALVHEAMGQKQAARTALTRALALAGEFPSREKAQEKLKALEANPGNNSPAKPKTVK
jgi:tetratricopeptide (TPR) repeat protein